jgi:hypothetical protein
MGSGQRMARRHFNRQARGIRSLLSSQLEFNLRSANHYADLVPFFFQQERLLIPKLAIETELESDSPPSASPEVFLFSVRVHSVEQVVVRAPSHPLKVERSKRLRVAR